MAKMIALETMMIKEMMKMIVIVVNEMKMTLNIVLEMMI